MEPDLQRISVKLLCDAPGGVNIDPVIAIFGRWRQELDDPADWVDLADYAHMPQGVGVLISGKHEAFSVDQTDPGIGLLFVGKSGFTGSDQERFVQAFRRALRHINRVIAEPEWPASIVPRAGDWLVTVNDRLAFPNTAETDARLGDAVAGAAKALFGDSVTLVRDEDPERRYAYRVTTANAPDLTGLADKAA